ncbi:putative caspase-like protein [Bradyrhizobium japonicum]
MMLDVLFSLKDDGSYRLIVCAIKTSGWQMVAFIRPLVLFIGINLGAWVAISPAFAAPNRYALVIGINNYPNLPTEKQLKTAVRDAQALGGALRSLGFQVAELSDPGLDAMAVGIVNVADQLRPGDTVLFFFAGHGASPDNTNLLLPSDIPRFNIRDTTAKELVRRHSYAESDIVAKLQSKLKDRTGRQDGLIIFVSDACRDNPFADASITRTLGGTDQNTKAKQIAGIFSIYAAGFGQESLDRLPDETASATQNSVFMRALLEKIRIPGKSLGDVAAEVRERVKQLAEKANRVQTVAVYDETLGGPIYLGTNPADGAAPVASPAPPIKYKSFNNRDINGGDYRTLQNVEADACIRECRASSTCMAFSYDKWNRWCFLKNRVSELLLDPRSFTGVREDVATPSISNMSAKLEKFRSKVFLGDGYRSMRASSYDTCQSSCETDLSCVVFTFFRNKQTCNFFKTAGEYFPDNTADSGIKSQTP